MIKINALALRTTKEGVQNFAMYTSTKNDWQRIPINEDTYDRILDGHLKEIKNEKTITEGTTVIKLHYFK